MPSKKPTTAKLKKKVWVAFSEYIRKRDGLRTTGSTEWALCITCGKRYHYKMLQAGHFIAGRHNASLFDEYGVHAQCYACNVIKKGNTLEYRRKMIELYGEGSDIAAENRAKEIRQFTPQELEEMLKDYKQRIITLGKENALPKEE